VGCQTVAVAYDPELADRIRVLVQHEDGLIEQRMFGGLAFLIHGNMAVAASSRGGLLLRVDPERTDDLVREDGAERFEMRGRRMNGWLHIGAEALDSELGLERWVATGVGYARSLPSKR